MKMQVTYNATLQELYHIADALRRFELAMSSIRVLYSPEYRNSVAKKYKSATTEERIDMLICMDLKERYDDYEIWRDKLRSIIATLKELPDIPTLSEFKESIKK